MAACSGYGLRAERYRRRPQLQGTLASGDLYHSLRAGFPGIYWGPGDMALAHATNEYVDPWTRHRSRVYATAMLELTAKGFRAPAIASAMAFWLQL